MFKYIITAILVVTSCVCIVPTQAEAAVSPLSLQIVPPVRFPSGDYTIAGARISFLFGKQRNIYGLDLGLLGNITEQDFTGLAISGLFNATMGTTNVVGLQLAGVTNINLSATRVVGIQVASVLNYNQADTMIGGLQLALANVGPHTRVYGFQVGIYNRAQDINGFQIGLINHTTNLHGIQIGLLNFYDTGLLAVSPIINIGF